MSEITPRRYPRFSMCGLNCGLCPRYHTDGASRCPGCGAEGFAATRPSCGVLTCGRRHGVEVCGQCDAFPCERMHKAVCVDSFISHRNMIADLTRAREEGLETYMATLDEKVAILTDLLAHYNDGRRKAFFCAAVNLLALQDLQAAMAQLAADVPPDSPPKERAAAAVRALEALAESRGISLKLRKTKDA